MNKERYYQIIDEVYQNYLKGGDIKWLKQVEVNNTPLSTMIIPVPYTQEELINKIKTDQEFSDEFGLKIEERELSLEERFNLRYPGGKFSVFQENYPNTHKRNDPNGVLDAFNIPTKLITLTYKDEQIKFYE